MLFRLSHALRVGVGGASDRVRLGAIKSLSCLSLVPRMAPSRVFSRKLNTRFMGSSVKVRNWNSGITDAKYQKAK